MNYRVVHGEGTTIVGAIKKLEAEVDRFIKEGYSLQGGVSTLESENGWVIACQAMVKE